ncbi:MAG: CDP-alcohol phosphatidyltransferase family protein [Ruminococcaceae bacterium]|nr:CDP-alcohol phosphatidyltransferase family protein [Oscillospiraceae bacterium]
MSGKGNSSIKNEIFTVPNILVYIRIILIPIFVWLYLRAKTNEEYYVAFYVMVAGFVTDFLDGKIARHFNCVTDLGKTIDPIADKLYQFAVALCLMVKYPLMLSVAAILFVKEISMGVMGLVLINKGGQVFGARWYGKVCTFFIDSVMAFLLLLPILDFEIKHIYIHLLIYACDVILVFASVMYTRLFASKIKALEENV